MPHARDFEERPIFYKIPPDAKPVVCRNCGTDGLFFTKTKNLKWILVEPTGQCHWDFCNK